MDERVHLHEGEQLLLTVRASGVLLVSSLLRSILEALLAAIILSVVIGLFLGASMGGVFTFSWALIALLLMLVRYQHWRHATLRVTTERILLQLPGTVLSHPLRTIKWNQYQESFLGYRGPVDLLCGVREIVIRYGNADSKLYVSFPALRLANDIKHFLDKVDSAVRRGEGERVRPFVFKRRGQRDEV